MSLTHNHHQLHPSEEVIENHHQQRAGEYIAKKQLLAKVTTFLRFVLIKTNRKIAQTEGQLEGEGVLLAPTAAG